ncbi:multiheme c-type cytochrome [Pirellulales bacterium]|nr:multiheme c-type cytochrome [Pirellulales bacterium]
MYRRTAAYLLASLLVLAGLLSLSLAADRNAIQLCEVDHDFQADRRRLERPLHGKLLETSVSDFCQTATCPGGSWAEGSKFSSMGPQSTSVEELCSGRIVESSTHPDTHHKLVGHSRTMALAIASDVDKAPASTHSNPNRDPERELTEVQRLAVDMAHAALYKDDPYPSATKCASCHPGHFREWSVSPHAYAQLSPVFNAMSGELNKLTNGTLGDFCIRCHTPIGMALNEPIYMSNMDRHPASREGVTCCVCHRINKAWGKGAGRQALVAAGLDGPIYGTLGNVVLSDVLSNPEKYGALKTDAASTERARTIHSPAIPFFQLHTAGFCGACHDVFAPNGFRLEDAFSEYKSSPAAREKQQSCQDCHMGEIPGVAAGYRIEAIAKLGNAYTTPRKRSNHMMAGPDYSIVHPGLFPHNPKAVREEHDAYAHAVTGIPGLATMREWLEFDYEASWGTEEFEKSDAAKELNEYGPEAWRDPARRYQARLIVDEQLDLLDEYTEARRRVLANGFGLGKIERDTGHGNGLRFRVRVYNKTDGHGVPTGFDAERVIFLRTIVWDANGKIVFVSGDLDPNGDIRDSHSVYVHNGKLPLDTQLFSLQTRFVTRNIRGGEREQVLNVPFSLDPLPYIRPATRPFTVLGRPLGARKHKQNLAANGGDRWASYHVDDAQLTGCGPYRVSVQLIEGMVPVNLIHEIEGAGFDYDLSARDVAMRVVNGHIVIQQRDAVLH